MAKHSFDLDVLWDLESPVLDDLKDLDKSEKQTLDEWVQFFDEKYLCVGWLVPPASSASN
jgi:hypothetical protein